MEDELDLLLEKGWWFSVIPKSKDSWHCTIYKRNPRDSWDGVAWKQLPTLDAGMSWIHEHIGKKISE